MVREYVNFEYDPEMHLTVKELIEKLSVYPDDAVVYFGNNDLSFQRIKNRGTKENPLLQFEFGEVIE